MVRKGQVRESRWSWKRRGCRVGVGVGSWVMVGYYMGGLGQWVNV
jgi:hypothetical protein